MVTSCSVKGCKSKAGQGIRFHRLPKSEIREAWITFLKKYNPLFVPTNSSTSVCGLHFLSDLDYEITPTSVYQTERLKKNAVPSIMYQNAHGPLFPKSIRELKIVSDHSAYEEDVVTLSLSDLHAKLPNAPRSVQNANIVSPKPTVQNKNIVSPVPAVQFVHATSAEPIIQNINEILSELVRDTVDKEFRKNNKRKCFMGDFKHPSDIDSPNNRLKYWIASQATVTKQKQKIKLLYKQTVDMRNKIKKLDNLIDSLKNEKKNSVTTLKESLSSSQHEIYMSMCKPI